jgi:hypothetical protein
MGDVPIGQEGDSDFAWSLPEDEWQAIALNYIAVRFH